MAEPRAEPGKFRHLKLSLPDNKKLSSAIPLVLQSNYQWNKATGEVAKGEASSIATSAIGTELQLVPEALELLKTIKKPVAVLAICGPCRSGKSFFISRVVGEPAFKLGHSMDACTRGIWLSTTALECDEFALLLLDTEGIGAVEGEGSESFTTKLLVTTILLSSFLIYNSMEVPKQADLQQMGSFAHLCTALTVSDKAIGNDPKEFQKYFPQFMWLLRDVTNPPCDEDGKEIPPIDYLNTEVLKPIGQEDCDNVVNAIRTLFPQPLRCECLPPPNEDPETLSLEEEKNIDGNFAKRSQEIIDGIKASIHVGFDKEVTITGVDLSELAKLYVNALNKKGSVPSLEGSWKAAIILKLTKEAKYLVGSYKKEMDEKLDGNLPMEESMEETDNIKPTLMRFHEEVFAKKRQVLLEEIHQLLPIPSKEESPTMPAQVNEDGQSVIEQFERAITVKVEGRVTSGVLFQFITDNLKKSEKQCEELWEKLKMKHKIDEQFTKALHQYNAEIYEDVCKSIDTLNEEYDEGAIGPAQEKVKLAKNEDLKGRKLVLQSIPGPPTNIVIVGKAMDAIKLQWDKPKINPGAAKKYIVEYRMETKAWVKYKVTTEQWHIVRELKSNTNYEFRVSSWNDEAEETKRTIEKMLEASKDLKGIKMGTKLGKLDRAMLSVIGFLSGTAVAPLLSTVGLPALAMKSDRKAAAAAACITIPFFATLGAPIVGGRVAYHIIKETGDWGDLEERYVPQENKPAKQGELKQCSSSC